MTTAVDTDTYLIYTDGSFRWGRDATEKFGAWASIVRKGDATVHELAKPVWDTTISRMELQAILEALRLVEDGASAIVHSDSQYAVNSLTRWLPGWIRNNWIRPAGAFNDKPLPVANRDILEELATHVKRLGKKLKVVWVPRNSTTYNERCDELAQDLTKKMVNGELTP